MWLDLDLSDLVLLSGPVGPVLGGDWEPNLVGLYMREDNTQGVKGHGRRVKNAS